MQHIEKGLMTFHIGKRNLSITAFMTALLATFLLVGCSVEDHNADGSALENWEVEEPSAASEAATAEEAFITGSADEAVTQASCSVVQFCNAPGGDGTRCIQQGCSVNAARAECIDEGWRVCNTPLCPWIFVARNGSRQNLCF